MTFEFRADREAHLRMLCEEMGQTTDEFINKAVLTFMEDFEDVRDARQGYKEFIESGEQGVTVDEVVKRYGLEDHSDAKGGKAALSVGPADPAANQQLPAHQTSRAA